MNKKWPQCLVHNTHKRSVHNSPINAENGSYGDKAIDIGRTIEGIKTHHVLSLSVLLYLLKKKKDKFIDG